MLNYRNSNTPVINHWSLTVLWTIEVLLCFVPVQLAIRIWWKLIAACFHVSTWGSCTKTHIDHRFYTWLESKVPNPLNIPISSGIKAKIPVLSQFSWWTRSLNGNALCNKPSTQRLLTENKMKLRNSMKLRKLVVEPTHLEIYLVKIGSSSPNKGENKKFSKPPPRFPFAMKISDSES